MISFKCFTQIVGNNSLCQVANGSGPIHEETSHINTTYSYTPGDYNLPQDEEEEEGNTNTRGHHSTTYQVALLVWL